MAKVADLPVEEQQKLVRADEPTLRGAVKALLRRRRESELARKTAEASATLGSKLYGVIYADPPWRAETWSENGKDRAAENHYPTMAAEDICALPVPAAANCVLFMWRPARMAEIALRVMTAWGFTFKSEYVWAKDRAITGYWNRNRHEVLMVGTRGTVPAPAPGDRWESIIEAHAGEHSTKPPVFAEMIEEMFPNVAKVELFARTPREGWDTWGNEVEITAAPSLVEGTEQIMDIGPGRVHHTTPIIIEDAANAEIGYQPSTTAAEHIVLR
jgi:N6-adenosine-specific RNA methylase IME4